jgi:hypothetical protein
MFPNLAGLRPPVQEVLLTELQRLLDTAGVSKVQELLPSAACEDAGARRPRTARVNTLKMSVAEALAWLRAPPPGEKQAQRWRELVGGLVPARCRSTELRCAALRSCCNLPVGGVLQWG